MIPKKPINQDLKQNFIQTFLLNNQILFGNEGWIG